MLRFLPQAYHLPGRSRILCSVEASNVGKPYAIFNACSGLRCTAARFGGARARSDALFEIVRPQALYERPIPERHRIAFYLGHLEAFDWNLFGRELPGLKSRAPEFDKLFAFGIDPVNGGLPDDQPKDWPRHEEILRYNQGVRSALDDQLTGALEAADDERPRALSQLLHVAIEHRLMHVETLAYMLHRLPINLKQARPGPPAPRAPQIRPRMTEIPAGIRDSGIETRERRKFWVG